MQVTQTFVNIAQLTMREAPWNWGFPSHHTLVLQRCYFAVTSAWSGNDQLCLESAAPTGVKRVHVNSLDVEGMVRLSNILKLQATFLYSFYHQQAGKTNLFQMRGGEFDEITWTIFSGSLLKIIWFHIWLWLDI